MAKRSGRHRPYYRQPESSLSLIDLAFYGVVRTCSLHNFPHINSRFENNSKDGERFNTLDVRRRTLDVLTDTNLT